MFAASRPSRMRRTTVAAHIPPQALAAGVEPVAYILTSTVLIIRMPKMRTTLTLDDDVADFLKSQSRLHDKPFKQLVNEVLRRGMAPASGRPARSRFRIVPNRSGLVTGVDPLRLNQLNDQLEAEDFAAESGG